ncbi:MAG: hypothetical protein Q9167_004534 [Letrouitia subvulpina]
MASTGSRVPVCAYMLISVAAALILLPITFHYQVTSAVKGYSLPQPALPSGTNFSQDDVRFPNGSYAFHQWPVIENLLPSNDEKWAQTLLPPNDGFLRLMINQTIERYYGISMFHALHCLQMLRVVARSSPMAKMSDGAGGGREDKHQNGTFEDLHMGPVHVAHCIGYIAQYILCAADGTLEPPYFIRNDRGEPVAAAVGGEGDQHQCRDARLLLETSAKYDNVSLNIWDWKPGDSIESVFGSGKG